MIPFDEKTLNTKCERSHVFSKMSGNVLFVDDDRDICDLAAFFLMRVGFCVRTVLNRDDALPALDNYLYDVIVMDLHMPGLSAREFVMTARQRCPRSQIVLITAAGEAESNAAELGIQHWIEKPFLPEEFADMLKRCLGSDDSFQQASA